MSEDVKKSGKDWAYFGPTDADGVRFMAKSLALVKMIKEGTPREPTEEEIAAEMGEAAKRLRVGLS